MYGKIRTLNADFLDVFFEISKLTVFVGDQGAGKSSIAKLVSLFSWELQYFGHTRSLQNNW